MNKHLSLSWSPIGLDIGSYRVVATQLDALGRVRAFASFGRREPESALSELEAHRIRSILDRQGFRGSRAVLSAPRAMVRSTTIELPPASSGAPIQQLAESELARIHRLAPNSFSFGLWELPPSARANTAPQTMAVTCRNDESDALCDICEHADLEPIAIDTAGLATIRALNLDNQGTKAILEFGESVAILTVVHCGTLVFERSLGEMTLRRLRSEVGKTLRLPANAVGRLLHEQGLLPNENSLLTGAVAHALELFVEEIAHSAAYASSRYEKAAIDQVYLVGAGASIPGLAEHLAKSLECEFIAPHLSEFATMREPLAKRPMPGEGIAALGLARWRSEAA
ncbi:MAG: pilus assembly protein PilM [Phycisphaerales bacterium JB065]